jgi:hypothetical protein
MKSQRVGYLLEACSSYLNNAGFPLALRYGQELWTGYPERSRGSPGAVFQ